MENRRVLSVGGLDYGVVAPSWFEVAERESVSSLSNGVVVGTSATSASVSEWVVRLTEEATEGIDSVESIGGLLSSRHASFVVDRGLGLPGLALVQARSANEQAAHFELQRNPHVAAFTINSAVEGTLQPNDPDFRSAKLIGLDNVGEFESRAGADVSAPQAWDINTGSTTVVVGIIDSGIDATHNDLYQNIWLNQGEIPIDLRTQLVDVDDDGLITFYDLNETVNAQWVTDFSPDNDYIDALDLLQDPRWADGFDTDGNGFVDDFFGWNFRDDDDEPFVANNPSDTLGHGTHVAGTIGATGNNGVGVTGINWQSSIMALKFLDESNQGDIADAIAALNYAKMMRTQFDTNIRVTNNSWGQPGSPNRLLEQAIEAHADAEILFVAAAGNGNVLGQGIDNDANPFFPASFQSDNIIAVAASDGRDRLARFTNFGAESVDLAAPGVGILSTLPGNAYGVANGTSMAAPHVTGAIALLYSELPGARLQEVRAAVLNSVDTGADGVDIEIEQRTSAGGRLNASGVLSSDVFAPTATITGPIADVTIQGGTGTEFEVRYIHRVGVDEATIGDDDLVVRRQFGPRDVIFPTQASAAMTSSDGRETIVRYRLAAPGGTWDPLDFGRYEISAREGGVVSNDDRPIPDSFLGSFSVRIDDPSVYYVDTEVDEVDANVGDGVCATTTGLCSLRAAVQESNAAAPDSRVIILGPQLYELTSLEGPSASNDSLTLDEDQVSDIAIASLLANDAANSGQLSLVDFSATSEQGAAIQFNSDGTLRYTPPSDLFGDAVDRFSYVVSNGGAQVSVGSVEISLQPVNDPPQAIADEFVAEKGSTIDIFPLANDNAGPMEQGAINLVSVQDFSAGGTAVINANGDQLFYTPATGFVGVETFTYTIADEFGLESTATVTVTLVDGILPPQANDDLIPVVEDVDTVFEVSSLLANDVDDAGIVSFVSTNTNSTLGTLTDLGNGTLRYSPPQDLFGTGVDRFTYSVTDGFNTSVGTVTIDIVPVNDPPVAGDDTIQIEANSSTTPLFVLANDLPGPIESGIDSVSIVSVDASGVTGSVTIASDGSQLSYAPASGFTGLESFTYTIQDVEGLTATAEVTINVVAPDQSFATIELVATNMLFPSETNLLAPPPTTVSSVAQSDTYFVEVWANTAALPPGGIEQANLAVIYDTLAADVVNIAPSTLFVGLPFEIIDDSFGEVILFREASQIVPSIDPSGDPVWVRLAALEVVATGIGLPFYAIESPLLQVSDGTISTSISEFDIDFDSTLFLNTPPVATDDSANAAEDQATSIAVLANDFAVNQIVSVGSPLNGSAVIDDNGTPSFGGDDRIIYTPDVNFVGLDSFIYTVANGVGQSTALVTVNVASNFLFELELDATQNGTSIVGTDGRFAVDVGERFDLEFRYSDLRPSPLGIFQFLIDAVATNTDTFRPVLGEVQILTVGETLTSGTGGSLLLGREDSSTVASIPIADLASDPLGSVTEAIEVGLGFGAGNVEIDFSRRDGDFRYTIRFTGDLTLADVPNLTADASGIAGANVTTGLIEVPVFLPSQEFNPDSLRFNLDRRSSSLGNLPVYNALQQGHYQPSGNETFDEVGGAGPIPFGGGGLNEIAAQNGLGFTGQDFEAFSIELEAIAPASDVTFTVDLAEDFEAILAYGIDEVIQPSEVLIDLSPGGGGRLIGTFNAASDGVVLVDVPNEPPVTDVVGAPVVAVATPAVPPADALQIAAEGELTSPAQLVRDQFYVANDVHLTRLEVLLNDELQQRTTAVTGVSALNDPSAGTVSLVDGAIFFVPADGFIGNASFTYTVESELTPGGQQESATQTVDVFVTAPFSDDPSSLELVSSSQSNDTTGDLNIRGDITIAADRADTSFVTSDGFDRLFKVYPDARLDLRRVSVIGGITPIDQDGGGILSAGDLIVSQSELVLNEAISGVTGGGGAVAVVGGNASFSEVTITDNEAIGGGGLFVSNSGTVQITASTFANNLSDPNKGLSADSILTPSDEKFGGGAILSVGGGRVDVVNSTLSGNEVAVVRDLFFPVPIREFSLGGAIRNSQLFEIVPSQNASLNGDGKFVVFETVGSLAAQDSNTFSDIYLLDLESDGPPIYVSRAEGGVNTNGSSTNPVISDDGRFVVFESRASNLISGDNNGVPDIFLFDRMTESLSRINLTQTGGQAVGASNAPAISADGRFVAYESLASNLVPGDTNFFRDIFRVELVDGVVEPGSVVRISQLADGTQGNGESRRPTISSDGNRIVYESLATSLDVTDPSSQSDIYLSDVAQGTTHRISGTSGGQVSATQQEPDGAIPLANPVILPASQSVRVSGTIGDGTFGATSGDYDFFQLPSLTAGQVVGIDIDARGIGSTLDSILAVYDASGVELAFNDDFDGLDSRLSFVAPNSGDYFVMVSGYRTLPLDRFDAGSGMGAQSTGTYELLITLNATDKVQPSISGDGTTIAFVDGTAIQVHDTATGSTATIDPAAFGFDGSQAVAAPSVSGDGNRIAFATTSDFTGVLLLDRAANTLTEASQRLSPEEFFLLRPDLSSDGLALAYESNQPIVEDTIGGVTNVFVRDLNTGEHQVAPEILFGAISLDHVSLVDNFGAETVSGPLLTHNSLYAGNRWLEPSRDLGLDSFSNGFNLLSDPFQTGAVDSSDVIDPAARDRVDPLQRRFGDVPTHALLNQSRARDAADPFSFAEVDQLGRTRPAQGLPAGQPLPDIGAIESVSNTVVGTLYDDIDGDGKKDLAEPGIVGTTVFLDTDGDGFLSPGEPLAITMPDDLDTLDVFEDGNFTFEELPSGVYDVIPLIDGFTRTDRSIDVVSVSSSGAPANNSSVDFESNIGISGDGSLVAFDSRASNLVSGDTNGVADVFVVDRITGRVELISVGVDGMPANAASRSPSISVDGRFVTFESDASNLVEGDTNLQNDVFLYDRLLNTVQLVSRASDGSQGNLSSSRPKISETGDFIVFESRASNLVPDDTNDAKDVFVFDRRFVKVQRVSLSDAGMQGNGDSSFGAISADGNSIVFESSATNLSPDDSDSELDIYLFDRANLVSRLISDSDSAADSHIFTQPAISSDGASIAYTSIPTDPSTPSSGRTEIILVDLTEGEAFSIANAIAGSTDRPSLPGIFTPAASFSQDGTFVAYSSQAPNVVEDDTNGLSDIFIYDRLTGETERVGLSESMEQGVATGIGIEGSFAPTISADGSFVAFASSFETLVDRDNNQLTDVFVTRNPRVSELGSIRLDVEGNEQFDGIDIGLVPLPGQISGRAFEDIIPNGVFDTGEPPIENLIVFLDFNLNGLPDSSEEFVFTDEFGRYSFDAVPGESFYTVASFGAFGFDQVLPPSSESYVVFLRGGDSITRRDFGFRESSTSGQFNNAQLSGRVYLDQDGDGTAQSNEPGMAGIPIFVDLNNDGTRQFNEPQAITRVDDPDTPTIDEAGIYSIRNLGNRQQTVRAVLPFDVIQTSPLGSEFDSTTISLRTGNVRFTNIQDVAVGDFGGDDEPDIAIALFDANEILVRINQGGGEFSTPFQSITVAPEGKGPIALSAAQFNSSTATDLVVANNLNGTATVLFDLVDGVASTRRTVDVGETPVDVATADIDDDGDIDFVVANESTGQLTLMFNDGEGFFSFAGELGSGGLSPASVTFGNFNGDTLPDIAVANLGNSPRGSDFGNIAVFINQGGGTFSPAQVYDAGVGPISVTAADVNNDTLDDVVVANFLSNTVSVFTAATDQSGELEPLASDLSVGNGPVQVEVADVDGDDDLDIFVTNLLGSQSDEDVSIVRNLLNQRGFFFEPAESFGLGQSDVSEQLSFAARDLNNDSVVDLVVANSFEDSVQILLNQFVNGSHRVDLTEASVAGLDFGVRPDVLLPTVDPIADPPPIREDALLREYVVLGGLSKPRAIGPELFFDVEAVANPELISNLSIQPSGDGSTASILFGPTADRNGTAVLSVSVIDAGADQDENTVEDNGVVTQLVTITVAAVNDAPTFDISRPVVRVPQAGGVTRIPGFVTGISTGGGDDESNQSLAEFVVSSDDSFFDQTPAISRDGELTFVPAAGASGTVLVQVALSDDGGTDRQGVDTNVQSFAITILSVGAQTLVVDGAGNTLDLSQPNLRLDEISVIDLRGTGDNSLLINVERIRTSLTGGVVSVLSDRGDTVVFDDGWTFAGPVLQEGRLIRRFTQPGATVNLVGPNDFTNPLLRSDVDGLGSVAASDALLVINELARRTISDQTGAVRAATDFELSSFRFFDTTADLRITAADALLVINDLANQSDAANGAGEAEGPIARPTSIATNGGSRLRRLDLEGPEIQATENRGGLRSTREASGRLPHSASPTTNRGQRPDAPNPGTPATINEDAVDRLLQDSSHRWTTLAPE